MAVDPAAVCDHGIFHNALGTDLMSGHTAVPAVNLPVLIEQVDSAVLRIQNLHIGLPKGRNRPYILPVAAEMVRVHFPAVPQQIGNDVVSKVVLRLRIFFVLDQVSS